MALPRPLLGGARLPAPLAPSDAARIRHVFALQARGATPEAMAAFAALSERRLDGHLLADRFLRRPDAATRAELADWLARYAELPDAPALRARLAEISPRGATLPPLPPAPPAIDADSPEDAAPELPGRSPALEAAVTDRVRAGKPDAALELIDKSGRAPEYAATLRAMLVREMLAQISERALTERPSGEFPPLEPQLLAQALHIADAGFRSTRGQVGEVGFMAGLAAWRQGNPALARHYFQAAALARVASPALRAAAAYWAARANLRAGAPQKYAGWMDRAGDEGRSFYGMLARRTMGHDLRGTGFNGAGPRELLSEADTDAILALPGGFRAFALLQVGQRERAEAELRGLYAAARHEKPLLRALYLVARNAGLANLAAELAGPVQALDGLPRDDVRFQLPSLAPDGGFRTDPALVYALIRTESNFDSNMVSSAGARGLMQILPRTAGFLAGNENLADSLAPRLHDPGENLRIGQNYIGYLARLPGMEQNLVRVLAGYNAGPAGLARWPALQEIDDPLMFMELIPITETRDFVRRALSYSWIYAARMRVAAPSLDELAAGSWPHVPAPRQAHAAAETARTIH